MATSENFNESMVRLTRHDISCVFKAKCTCYMNNLRETVNMPHVFASKGSHDESSSSDEDDKNQG